MLFDPKDLETLAGALVSKGAPILGRMVGTAVGGPLGGFVGGAVGDLIPQIAQTLGLPADADPAQVTAAVQAAPAAPNALVALEEKHKNDLAWAQLQVDQNNAELAVQGPSGLRFFYGGWRPAMGWLAGPVLLTYILVLFALGRAPLPTDVLGLFISVWLALAGVRTFERFQGIALDSVLPAKKK